MRGRAGAGSASTRHDRGQTPDVAARRSHTVRRRPSDRRACPKVPGPGSEAGRGRTGHVVIRLGRISYMNMAPVFYRLEADVHEVQGVPTDLDPRLVDGGLDLRP